MKASPMNFGKANSNFSNEKLTAYHEFLFS